MSEESTTPGLAEQVREFLRAANHADFDSALAFYAPTAVWVMADAGERFEGVDAIRRHWEDWYSNYEDFRFDAPEVIDLGGGVVWALARQGGRLGGGSGELRQDLALVYEWSQGRVVRVTVSFQVDDARMMAERLAAERA